jgi:hypothetical protein
MTRPTGNKKGSGGKPRGAMVGREALDAMVVRYKVRPRSGERRGGGRTMMKFWKGI